VTSESPWRALISTDKVFELHQEAVLRFSQAAIADSMSARDCVDGKIGNAWTAESYTLSEDAIPGICFAGYLLFYLVTGHCFADGNKRAGWASAMSVLAALGLTVKATDDEAETLVLEIASGVMKEPLRVVSWLAARLEAPGDISRAWEQSV
jgi:death on curing protein